MGSKFLSLHELYGTLNCLRMYIRSTGEKMHEQI